MTLCVPAFAAELPYTPPIPKFIYPNGNTVGFTGTTTMDVPTNPAFTAFMESLLDVDQPFMVLIQQNAKNAAFDAAGTDYDHKYWLYYIRFPKATKPYNVGWFEYWTKTGSNPMRFCVPNGCEMVSYFYDHEKDNLVTSGKVEKWSSPISFTYVMMSSGLSNSVSYYPNYNTLAGVGEFTVHSNIPGTDRHYNWWLTIDSETS